MARICEKNTCPTGIATHDPKYKAKYKGTKEDVIHVLKAIANDVRLELANMGIASLSSLPGRGDLLKVAPHLEELVSERGIDLSVFQGLVLQDSAELVRLDSEGVNKLNCEILNQCQGAIQGRAPERHSYTITTGDRAVPSPLFGEMAAKISRARLDEIEKNNYSKDTFNSNYSVTKPVELTFTGSAGQGFAAFMVDGVTINLFGEANDSVAKSMSGGLLVINPHPEAIFNPATNGIVGNCCLYGATGGTVYINGIVGDRFAVRNSGAVAVVEGVGLHACEYMTNGSVIMLGSASHNIGAGMTGGELFIPRSLIPNINRDYIDAVRLEGSSRERFFAFLEDYVAKTGSQVGKEIIKLGPKSSDSFVYCLPNKEIEKRGYERLSLSAA